ncbi:methylmalonyl-CoA mutase [Sulfodiicoccus acidiphilus]|uniref:Methylmalonyl-CoA mutase n=1 Tax=Sulfodiicoccus acidiphilus TaxID=1670455 RepID=A0A830GXG2_9CREN|nr:cobalamin B12-binding domain-containing protein [Sulfodiicoccus acidiphilus]GGT90393.1 methylmalonyl-CoA mutase [Sulfodiicoccus acidiphilus]
MEGRIKVVVGKLGLDGHDRGAKVIARALSEAGMEVVYTGLRQTPEQLVRTVVQEDADVLGVSVLSGAHMELMSKLMELLNQRGIKDITVVLGGIIPKSDIEKLRLLGVDGVFPPGTMIDEVVKFIKGKVAEKRGKRIE